ncbi:hypothetical protein COCC4DRAFT_63167 [Bipolaris maydis ATCC 48331]|uniref:Uncharacterized protein n=2 Tax=Cochliobolus heterostrophus TaxID=5016 RepID=M2VCN6_COCH5|nr:uncharacterized protein COCC4DRAFT_63167 [Bipolaris maydis ATCC 48331]EMD97787.1 hypothetical protein COCHEDRAFT_1151369 [Bipolaris maydis C5]ENI02818.1 hypothetical protein COCC4DRAFT_63167 [Bipolaris maydis ATCC 48331]
MNQIHPNTYIQSFEAQKASRGKIPNGLHVMDLLTAMHTSLQGVSPRLAELSSARIGKHANSKICNAVTCRRTYRPVHSGKNSSPGSFEHPSHFRRKPCSPPSVLQAI